MTSQQFFKKLRKVGGCLVCNFKQPFSVFKQHFTQQPWRQTTSSKSINSGSGQFKLELSESTQSSWLGMCGVNSLDPMNLHSELDELTRITRFELVGGTADTWKLRPAYSVDHDPAIQGLYSEVRSSKKVILVPDPASSSRSSVTFSPFGSMAFGFGFGIQNLRPK